ncbi:MAG TPA: short-chain dehydrogenase/reductase [Burkholderiales bacterium]|nr:short-chain dehydrogenase/reductase [Burkholderiales bacterium]
MDLGLGGKTALITGGSKGIGLATAMSFAAEGCNVHLAARTAADLETAKAKILAAHKVGVTTHAVDLSQAAAARKLAQDAGDIDVLVNNAGAIPGGSIAAIDDEKWRKAWDLKVFGYINLTREVYARMQARKSGVIVNIIGMAGERPSAGYIAGATANAGLMAFTKALGAEGPDFGVRVVAINPGMTQTERLVTLLKTDAQAKYGDASRWEELAQERAKQLPFKRAGRPEEIGDVAAFLASDRASYVSGIVVFVDAGNHLRK